MSSLGKIERLPREVREELNLRLDNNEPGGPLLEWLNGRREVRQVLKEQFAGAAITKQNLSDWRNGGFAVWQFRRDWVADARELAADAGEVEGAIHRRLADALATVLTARYASVLHRWDGEVSEAFMRKLRTLRMMCQDVTRLRQGEHSEAKLKIQEGWLEEAREKTEAEVVEKFEEWAENKDVHDWLVQTWVSPKDRERRKRELLGLPPLEGESKVQSSKSQVEAASPAESSLSRKSNVQTPKSKQNSNLKLQASVEGQPADDAFGCLEQTEQMEAQEEADWAALERATPAGQAGSSPVNPRTGEKPDTQPGPWDLLPPNVPRSCAGPCMAGPQGYCLKCFWKPGEIGQPTENLPAEFAKVIAARRRAHELVHTAGRAAASPESAADSPRPPAPPVRKIPSPCVGGCRRDPDGHCRSCGRSIPEVLRWPTMSEAEKAQMSGVLAQRLAKLGGGSA